MKTRRKFVALGSAGVFALATGACTADVKTQSNVDTSYGRKLDRLLVSVALEFSDPARRITMARPTYLQAGEVVDSLRAAFGGTGVTTDFVTDPAALAAATARFRPTQILSLGIADATRLGRDPLAFTISCQIVDTGTQKTIWRAAIAFAPEMTAGTPGLGLSKRAADNLANSLVGKLREDGLA